MRYRIKVLVHELIKVIFYIKATFKGDGFSIAFLEYNTCVFIYILVEIVYINIPRFKPHAEGCNPVFHSSWCRNKSIFTFIVTKAKIIILNAIVFLARYNAVYKPLIIYIYKNHVHIVIAAFIRNSQTMTALMEKRILLVHIGNMHHLARNRHIISLNRLRHRG